jgi:hypothetical protein
MTDFSPWLILFGLGAFHGLNPGMGWLFAVALGLQEQKRAALLRALPPIALGHALSVGITVAVVLLARISLPHALLKFGAATILFAFGLYRLFRSRHPNWVGMRVGFRDLALWSFIMASAHGAGLMLVPLFITSPSAGPALYVRRMDAGLNIEPICSASFSSFSTPSSLAGSVGVHALGHFLVAGFVAFLVYERLGVAILRRAWFNLDLLWTVALMATGAFIVVL